MVVLQNSGVRPIRTKRKDIRAGAAATRMAQGKVNVIPIPTATPFARNAIFSGLLPNDLKEEYPDLWKKMFYENKLNGFESSNKFYHLTDLEIFKKLKDF